MDIKDVEKLIALMEAHGLSEIEIEDSNGKIRLKKENGNEMVQEIIEAPDTADTGKQNAPPAAGSGEPKPLKPGIDHICSPLVGTFFRKPDPESEPFVNVGDRVDPDTVICVVEAMKVMNEIKSEKTGTITKVLIDDVHPVEYMQPIFEIKTET